MLKNIWKKFAGAALVLGMIATPVLAANVQDTSVIVYADDSDPSLEAEKQLGEAMRDEVLSNSSYKRAEGGTVAAQELITTEDDGVIIYTKKFGELSQEEQEKINKNVVKAQEKLLENESSNITKTTVSNWWKRVTDIDGVGTQYLTMLLSGTKADIAGGAEIFEPLSGPIGLIIGVICIALFAFFTLSMALDLTYICLPFVQLMIDGSGSGKGDKAGKGEGVKSMVSQAAKDAVKNDGGGMSGGLGYYFKHSAVKLIVLALCILFLISGQIYTVIGWILNLVEEMFSSIGS